MSRCLITILVTSFALCHFLTLVAAFNDTESSDSVCPRVNTSNWNTLVLSPRVISWGTEQQWILILSEKNEEESRVAFTVGDPRHSITRC